LLNEYLLDQRSLNKDRLLFNRIGLHDERATGMSFPGTPQQEAPPQAPPPQAPPPQAYLPSAPLSTSDEHTWAMLAHLSVLLNLVTGFLGPIIAMIIYLVFKERSRYVAYQSLQAALFQLIGWVGGGVIIGLVWGVTGVLSAVIVGLLCIPFALIFTVLFGLLPVATLVYGVYAAIQAGQGQDFRYWLVGDWLRGTLNSAGN
jgi:uncharacterized Tic20 family protein